MLLEAVYFSGGVLPQLRFMTALGLYFDRVHLPIMDDTAREALQHAITVLGEDKSNTLSSHTSFYEKFKGLKSPDFHFMIRSVGIDNIINEFRSFIPDNVEIPEKLNEIISYELIPALIHSYTSGYYSGYVKGIEERGAAMTVVPLSYIQDKYWIPPHLNDDSVIADILSASLAIEAIKISLPDLEAISPEDILWAKDKLREELVPFRMSMYEMSRELRAFVKDGAKQVEILKEAQFHVKTVIHPKVLALKRRISLEGRGFTRRVLIKGLESFKLIANYIVSPNPVKIADVACKASTGLLSYSEYRDRVRHIENEAGISYLAKLPLHLKGKRS